VLLAFLSGRTLAAEGLPGTRPLDWTDDLSVRIIQEAHRRLDGKLEASVAARQRLWKRDFSGQEAYEKSVEPNREHFRKCIGVVDPRLPVAMERYGDDSNPALVAQTERYCVFQVRWPVLEGVWGEGLLLEPKQEPIAYVVAIPDADQTPEQIVGLAEGVKPSAQFARRLAENGCQVVVPVLVDRACDFSGNPEVRMTNQPHREWIYRQAYEMGRHVIGYEVQKVLSVVDWFEKTGGPGVRIAVAGYAEGGLIAFYSAAVDKRIAACLVSGYFDSRQRVWEEPIYRNVWNLLREFGDAELASLISPRALVVEYSVVPKIDGPPQVAGRRGAAPGRLGTPALESVRGELARSAALDKGGLGSRRLLTGPAGQPTEPGSQEALAALLESLGQRCEMSLSAVTPLDRRTAFHPQMRQRRQVEELVTHVQLLQRRSDAVRDEWFLNETDRHSAETFVRDAQKYRQIFRDEVIGSFDDPLLPPAPRTRRIYNEAKWTGYEIVLDVWPELHAWGILCLPKGIPPGEKRPAVVCQHGLGGVPRDVIERAGGGFAFYKAFAAELADRGFVTFAPFNLYSTHSVGDHSRMLRRKAGPLRASYFSIIAPQHQQILNWLASLPYVDKSRIGFYGLSYGGVSAMRLPALLEGYALSICSANFNDWIRKNVSVEFPASYMFTHEWEMFDFDLGHTFNYAEMAYLIFPRPFMVERGHRDGVAPGSWVEYEYAKIRCLYDTLGLGDRTEIEFFNGGHEIHGVGTFQFLQQHLNWPAPPIGKTE
jgi:dienelactone hydrolase